MDNARKDYSIDIASLLARIERIEKEIAILKGTGSNELYYKPSSSQEAIDIIIDTDNDFTAGAPAGCPDTAEPGSESALGQETVETGNAAGPVPDREPADDSYVNLFGELRTEDEERSKKKEKSGTAAMASGETAGKAFIDVMAEKQAWWKDLPGSEVKDLRSAIGLGDRVFFINSLFRGDYALYQDTIDRLNGMADMKSVMEYLSSVFPQWDLESDGVYRFMMAVRRKIR